jgi:hypothetical protein
MKIQEGYLTEESGAWIGHFSRWIVDARTGERKRQQRAFKIGAVADNTKTAAREALRARIVIAALVNPQPREILDRKDLCSITCSIGANSAVFGRFRPTPNY